MEDMSHTPEPLTVLASWSLKIAIDVFIHIGIVFTMSDMLIYVGLFPIGASSSSCFLLTGPVNF
jgi:hypothetical protein